MLATVINLASHPTSADPALVGHFMQYFIFTAGVLGALMLVIVLFSYLRHRRVGRGSADPPRESIEVPDAWTEAGRRAEPFEAPGTPRGRRGDADPEDS